MFSDKREEALTAKIASALTEYCALGTVERNVEIKVVAPLLELLGWDPALEVNWGFRIPIVFADGTYTKREADVVIADQDNIYMVGEVKAARLDGDPWAAIMQLLNYMHALDAPRGFITNGHTWLLINDRPLPRQHPFTTDVFDHVSAHIEVFPDSFAESLAELGFHLSPRRSVPRKWSRPDAFFSGISARGPFPLSPQDWSPHNYDDSDLTGRLVEGLIRVSHAMPGNINLGSTVSGLVLCSPAVWFRERGSRRDKIGNTLLTVNPSRGLGTLYISAAALRDLGCTQAAIEDVLHASNKMRRRLEGSIVDEFLDGLEKALSGSLAVHKCAVIR